MVHESGIRFTIEQCVLAIENSLPGVLVECGVWRGGCSLTMLLAQRAAFGKVQRPVYMLDSFAGLPLVDDRDGPLAKAWQEGADPEKFFDNCKAAENELLDALDKFGFDEPDCYVVKGWFHETVPQLVQRLQSTGISFLRLDSDWYASTEVCLVNLVPLVAEEGIVIIDDYYAWDGCARAVHDYLSKNNLPYRIKSLFNCYGGYFVKRAYRNNFEIF